MTVVRDNLLLKFPSRDTPSGVTRNTVRELAELLDMNGTQVIHMALSKFVAEVLPAYAPKGKTLSIEVLFQ